MAALCAPVLAWVAMGALGWMLKGDDVHWAYRPLETMRPPATAGAGHPVDAFIDGRLRAAGVTPAPEAPRMEWLRRVTFDLTGLAPTPEEMAAFDLDLGPGAHERVVDRLLASPRHGERWARHWMDAAHFAETHGHDQDRVRTHAWPYRDYLVQAFNGDVPYARFVQEQVAGDVLFPERPEATAALGFVAGGPWDESSLRDIREDTTDRQVGRYVDRDDMLSTVMGVFASTTVQCARCHDHKFDPVPQSDYYALQAVFAGVERAHREYHLEPGLNQRRRDLRLDLERVARKDAARLLGADAAAEVAAWEGDRHALESSWRTAEWDRVSAGKGVVWKRLPDGSLLASGENPERDDTILEWRGAGSRVTALRLEVLPDPSLPKNGPGRAVNGNLHLSEMAAEVLDAAGKRLFVGRLGRATASHEQEGWRVGAAWDGDEKTAWGIHPREGEAHAAVFELAEPLTVGDGERLVVRLAQRHGGSHTLGRFRMQWTGVSRPPTALPPRIAGVIARPPAERTEAQRMELAAWVLGERLNRELASLPRPLRVYAIADVFEPDAGLRPPPGPREVRVLRRGDIGKPGELARPGALACVAGMGSRFDVPEGSPEGARRAALAAWLTSRDNGLVWRSAVNRAWHHHFGRGLVATPNDFGRMGATPTHPELLDWLARWFRDDARGSMKALHRLLVTSAAYRRSSRATPEAVAADPDNALCSRMARRRLDAECVRDALLQASGRIDLRMGGPGDMQFDMKPGIHVTPRVDYAVFDVDSAAGARRSVYRFLFRTLPDPFFEALDCPAGDQMVGARDNTVTVQQALALWNNAFVARQCGWMARRLEREDPDVDAALERACLLLWGRKPDAGERTTLVAHARRHGLESACRVLANSNAFVFVE